MAIEDQIEFELILNMLHKLLIPDNFDEMKYFLSNKKVFKNQKFTSNVVSHIIKLEEIKTENIFDARYINELRKLRDMLLGNLLNKSEGLGYIIQSYNFKTKDDLTFQDVQLKKMEKQF